METNQNNSPEEEVVETNEIALLEQDKSTVAILQPDDLKTLNEAVEKLKSFKKKYTIKKLAVADINSKDQKEKLRLAIAEVRTTKTSLEKDKKEKTKPYRDTVAFLNGSYDKVIEVAEKILEPLKDHKKEVDDKIEAAEKEAELLEQKKVNDRVDALQLAGAVFHNSFYEAGDEELGVPLISLGEIDLKSMTDSIWENVLSQVKEKVELVNTAKEKKTAELAEQKRIADEKAAEEKRLFEEQQAALKKQQEEFQQQQAEFKRQQEELADAQQKLENDRLSAEKEKQEKANAERKAHIDARYDQLFALGMRLNGQYECYAFEDVNVDNKTEICLFNDVEWQALIDKITPAIAERKELARIREEEELKAEQKRIADKAIADKKLADEAEAKRKQDELVKQGDKALWEDFVSRLKAISYPETKSPDYKNKVSTIQKFIDSLS